MNERDYPFIRAWCQMMGSLDYYVTFQVQLAREEGAPENAIYRADDLRGVLSHWETTDDVTRADTRRLLRLTCKSRGFPDPYPDNS